MSFQEAEQLFYKKFIRVTEIFRDGKNGKGYLIEGYIVVEQKKEGCLSNNSKLMEEWNWERNNDISPARLTIGSHKKVWWKCREGHEWEAEVKSRYYGNGCPYCSGRFAIAGKNDLQTVNPSLSAEWNYEKNDGLTPADVTSNSGKKVWWKCSKGHEWQATICTRNKGNGCPYCGNKKILRGYNDLQTINPVLSEEWNYQKNDGLTPADVMPNSGKKVWWKCQKGHEWQQKIYHRNNGVNCPICHSERNTSIPEFALLYYLKKAGTEVIHSYKDLGYELDIYIPSQKVAIEYDGFFWHKSKTELDLEKNRLCKKDGIRLYRIREGLPSLMDTSIDFVIQKDQKKDLEKAVKKIIYEILGIIVDVNLRRDAIAIENERDYIEKNSSILSLNPTIAFEWNYDKNGNLKPEFFASNSGKIVWWKCSKGHEWQAAIQSRNKGNGCPYCSGRFAITGENDLQTINPELAKEWNNEKTSGITPADVLPNSDKIVWWKCSKGHEWKASVGNRSRGNGCPYCSGRFAITGENDLQTINPELAKEWSYEQNDGLTPEEVTPNSNKKVWWKCSKGHEWQAAICDRNRGNGCPYCAGKKVSIGFNDLQTINPVLSEEWNYQKNDGLTPMDVMPNSNKVVWWKCKVCGFEWKTSVCNRNLQNTGCPKCVKKRSAQLLSISYRVMQLSLDKSIITVFDNPAEAERQTGIKRSSIMRVCRGDRKSAGGYFWKYVE